MKRLIVVLVFLTMLVAIAVPTLAGDPHSQIRARGWTQMFPPVSPPPRGRVAMAYDTARGVAVLFGGYDSNGTERDDTWEWSSSPLTWAERLPVDKPIGLSGAAMAYDEARGVSVLFGGHPNGVNLSDQTWEWNGVSWTQRFPETVPAARWLHRMMYDPVRQKIVMVGGDPLGAQNSDETWEFDGVNWVERTDIAPFTARYGFGLAYDPLRDVTVMFAGDDGAGLQYFKDTWERAGDGDWVQMTPPNNPPPRKDTYAVYYPRLGRAVVFGGINWIGFLLTDTLAWNGSQWQQANPPVHPTGTSDGMVYDPVNQAVLLYSAPDGSLVGETWYLR